MAKHTGMAVMAKQVWQSSYGITGMVKHTGKIKIIYLWLSR